MRTNCSGTYRNVTAVLSREVIPPLLTSFYQVKSWSCMGFAVLTLIMHSATRIVRLFLDTDTCSTCVPYVSPMPSPYLVSRVSAASRWACTSYQLNKAEPVGPVSKRRRSRSGVAVGAATPYRYLMIDAPANIEDQIVENRNDPWRDVDNRQDKL